MAQHRPHIGRLRKHIEGWDGANKRIFILKSTYEQWGQLKQLKNLHNDNACSCSIFVKLLCKSECTAMSINTKDP